MAENRRGGGGEEGEQSAPRRPKPKKHAAHSGAWKVAYADFVTAMMALFIVLWVLGQDDKVKQAVQSYFRDPVAYYKSGGAVIAVETDTITSTSSVALKEAINREMEEEVERMRDLLSESSALNQILDQIVFQVTDEGIRMEFRDASKFSFFNVGSAQVSPELKEIFRILTPEITNTDRGVVIEGHTDRRPYGTESYTNWELSADRANSVRRVMLSDGLQVDKINEVRAYADTRPLNNQDPFDLQNRRVSILLKNQLKLGK